LILIAVVRSRRDDVVPGRTVWMEGCFASMFKLSMLREKANIFCKEVHFKVYSVLDANPALIQEIELTKLKQTKSVDQLSSSAASRCR
jgi:hypothetical protein